MIMNFLKRLFRFASYRYRQPYDRRSGYDRRLLRYDPMNEKRVKERRRQSEHRKAWKRVTQWSSVNIKYSLFDPIVYRYPF